MSAASAQRLVDRVSTVSPTAAGTMTLIRELAEISPAPVAGKFLAQRCGFTGNAHAALCFHFLRANEALAPLGLAIGRSGGAPHDTYVLRPLRPSQAG